jgi:uncharacterized membrane protein YoaK (UPF0700 family)
MVSVVSFCSRWFSSTKKAAWTLSTTFIVLIVPMILSMDRESVHEEQANAMHALTGGEKKA